MECPLSQTACKITKNIGFNIFYGIINFIQKARFNNSAAQKKEKRPMKEALQVYRQRLLHHSFVTFTVNVWNGNSSPSLGNVSYTFLLRSNFIPQ